jgi:hypothetical protein
MRTGRRSTRRSGRGTSTSTRSSADGARSQDCRRSALRGAADGSRLVRKDAVNPSLEAPAATSCRGRPCERVGSRLRRPREVRPTPSRERRATEAGLDAGSTRVHGSARARRPGSSRPRCPARRRDCAGHRVAHSHRRGPTGRNRRAASPSAARVHASEMHGARPGPVSTVPGSFARPSATGCRGRSPQGGVHGVLANEPGSGDAGPAARRRTRERP